MCWLPLLQFNTAELEKIQDMDKITTDSAIAKNILDAEIYLE